MDTVVETPIDPPLVEELFEFWVAIFGGPIDVTPEALLGHEGPEARLAVYLRRIDGGLAGACLLATSTGLPSLGGFGEVATSPRFRRRGIATELCRRAVDDFRERGGQALFLGTENPGAARVYHRLGWRKLAGANLMANVSDGRSPEEFLVDYFRGLGPATVRAGTPADRVPMIPLLVSPHDWHVLDSNVGMMSTRYAVQGSCLGLYRRYSALAKEGRGAWFSAVTEGGHVVGLSTARLDRDGGCRMDAFTHGAHLRSLGDLIQAASGWGSATGASPLWTAVSAEDEEKRSLLQSAGFRSIGPAEPLDVDGRRVPAIRLERS